MKKLSKRLLAMLLVAVMVVAAIPFGAFADDTYNINVVAKNTHGTVIPSSGSGKADVEAYVEQSRERSVQACLDAGIPVSGLTFNSASFADNTLTVLFDVHTWTFVSATSTQHTMKCSIGNEQETSDHVFNSAGVCRDCGWSHEHSFTGGTVVAPGDANGHKVQCTFAGCTEQTTAPHTGEHYTDLPAEAADCENTGHEAGKRYDCGYVEGYAVTPALGHIDENCDGKCDRAGCTENMTVQTKTYKVVVKKADKVTVLAEGQSVTYNQAQINALNSASAVRTFLDGLGGDYATCSGKMGDAYFKGVEVMSSDAGNYLHIYMDLPETSNTLPNTGDTFNVTFTIDGGTSYTRTVNVGDWYFNAGMAGNANGWGNKQVSLRITNALGSKRLVDWNSKDSSAYVQRGDVSVEIFSKLKTVKIVFLKNEVCSVKDSNGTTVEYEWGSALGQLPELPYGYGYWCVDGKEITATTIYNWELDKVYARPVKQTADHNGNVHLFVYNSSNQLMKDFDVTVKVQDNGMLFLDDLVSMIKNNTGVSSVSSAGLMDESGWAYYLNNKNSTKYAKSGLLMGTAAEREGVQNVYVVLKNVSGNSNADTSNPKTGDTAMIGTAAIVMALATVGMGTAFYMKKKELF